jgi:hypothetical protein
LREKEKLIQIYESELSITRQKLEEEKFGKDKHQ